MGLMSYDLGNNSRHVCPEEASMNFRGANKVLVFLLDVAE